MRISHLTLPLLPSVEQATLKIILQDVENCTWVTFVELILLLSREYCDRQSMNFILTLIDKVVGLIPMESRVTEFTEQILAFVATSRCARWSFKLLP